MTENSAVPDDSTSTATANLKLSCEDWQMQMKVSVPTGPITLHDLLPLAQSLTDAVVGAASQQVAAEGKSVSCCAGCGACCRQLVPITPVEAHRLREVVEALPEPRRSQILERFEDALHRLAEAGLLEILQHPEKWLEEGYVALGLRYFQQGIPCPFLEEESCSIYLDRPLSCREYLVTSPAENCQHPTQENIDRVRMPVRLSPALARFRRVESAPHLARWVPLVLALEWAADDTTPAESQPGPELFRKLIDQVSDSNPLEREGCEHDPGN